MKRKLWMLGAVAVLLAVITFAIAQPQPGNPNAPAQQPGQGGPFGGGPPAAFFARMMPAVTSTTEKYLFVVRGGTVYQLDVNSLEILKQQELPTPEMPPPPGGGQQPQRQ